MRTQDGDLSDHYFLDLHNALHARDGNTELLLANGRPLEDRCTKGSAILEHASAKSCIVNQRM